MRSFRWSSGLKCALGLVGVLFAVSGQADSIITAEETLASDADIAVFGSYKVLKDDRMNVTSRESYGETKASFVAVEVTPWMYLKEYSDKNFTYKERYKVYIHDSVVDSMIEWEEAGEDRLFFWAIEDSQWIQHLGYPVFLETAREELTAKVEALMKAVEAGKRHGPLSLQGMSESLDVHVKVEEGIVSVTVSNQTDASVWLAEVFRFKDDPEEPMMAHGCRGFDPELSGFGDDEDKWRSLQGRSAHSAVFAELSERQASFIGYTPERASKPFELPPGESHSFEVIHPFPTERALERFQHMPRIRYEVPIFPSDELLNSFLVESNEVDASLFR